MRGAAALRERLDQSGILVAPGIYDHMSLLLAQKAGFETLYASGYWGTASALGEPDVGIAGYSDFIGIFRRFAEKSTVPIIADADTGFGSLTNLDRAVRGYQCAGIAAMQIEDRSRLSQNLRPCRPGQFSAHRGNGEADEGGGRGAWRWRHDHHRAHRRAADRRAKCRYR